MVMPPSRRHPSPHSANKFGQNLALVACGSIFLILMFFTVFPSNHSAMENETKAKETLRNLKSHIHIPHIDQLHLSIPKPLHLSKPSTHGIPGRLVRLREKEEIVGEYLKDVMQGVETVEEIVHGTKVASESAKGKVLNALDDSSAEVQKQQQLANKKPPMTLTEIVDYFQTFLHTLHQICAENKRSTFTEIWQSYHDLAIKTLYPWDREYLQRMPQRREDGSIFLSLATYRDENCLNTLTWAFEKAKYPEKLFVGLVQQNCEKNCRSGILEGDKMTDVEPDQDCHLEFCESEIGKKHCEAGRIRALHINETESLGPYAARYFASKLWYGEQWFMQIDAHMTFLQDWDSISMDMLKMAPSNKPFLSHYPPAHTVDLEKAANDPAPRLCGPVFATSDLESQIIRLEGGLAWDNKKSDVPKFAPFTAAGYLIGHSDFLREVPFDPFLPWIFMGEEIIMSSRLWTSGYDIFSPSQSVVGHMYVRRHKPKFWEAVHRVFTFGIHNPLQMLVLSRIKYQLGYPEAARDMIKPKSVLTAVEQYSMGTERTLDEYLKLVGLNMTEKKVTDTKWCETGRVPPGFEQYAPLYEQ